MHGHKASAWPAALLLTVVMSLGATSASVASVGKPTRGDRVHCPLTIPDGSGPGIMNYGNGRIFVGLPRNGEFVAPTSYVASDGTIGVKFPWWRAPGVRGVVRIGAVRIGIHAPLPRSYVPSAYGKSGFQASTVFFPTQGCWRVTGRVGDFSLTFVLRIRLIS
jgi:hypothetical protein